MTPLLILAAAAAVGVEVGWQPLPEGGHEYTIQIEPQLLNILKSGQDITSEVPPQLEVRRYRVTIGTERLAREDGVPAPARRPVGDEPPAAIAENRPSEGDDIPPATPGEPTVAAESPPQDTHAPTPTVAETAQTSDDHTPDGAAPPGKLPAESATSTRLGDTQPAAHHEVIDAHSADKPALEPERPWTPFLVSGVLLCCSLGANLYLGWIAWEARNRYRQAVAKFRTAVS